MSAKAPSTGHKFSTDVFALVVNPARNSNFKIQDSIFAIKQVLHSICHSLFLKKLISTYENKLILTKLRSDC